MPKNDVAFASAVASRMRSICIDLLRDNPSMTLAELRRLCRGEFGKVLSNITLGELFAGGKATAALVKTSSKQRRTKKPARTVKARPAAMTAIESKSAVTSPAGEVAAGLLTVGRVDTRTPAGQHAFDEAVFAALKSFPGPIGADAIQEVTGGTGMQVYFSCCRLIIAGRAKTCDTLFQSV